MTDTMGLATYLPVISASFCVALLTYLALSYHMRRFRPSDLDLLRHSQDEIAFLFDNKGLVDATEAAERWLATLPGHARDWPGLVKRLSPRFPGLATNIGTSIGVGGISDQISIGSQDANDASRLTIDRWPGFTRLQIHLSAATRPQKPLDQDAQSALLDEMKGLRNITDASPVATWRQNPAGVITWANTSYLALCDRVQTKTEGVPDTWPPINLFDIAPLDTIKSTNTRHQLEISSENSSQWYDCLSVPAAPDTLHFAQDAGAVVAAETALREFRQTLSKTFAHLPTGLAIFDRKKTLTLFNPALIELTRLPVDFLSSRPSLFALLDRLRSQKMIPEPKDYKLWRRQMSQLEYSAFNGFYEETWTLTGGQTIRVTGRPYPDGAVAFLLDDISSEISLTRHFREELELNQAVLDGLEEAVAVFSADGQLTLSNAAYTDLWKSDPSSVFGKMTIIDATRHWQNLCHPTPIWGDLREFVQDHGERVVWAGDVRMCDDRTLSCKITPIGRGATLVRFSQRSDDVPLHSNRTGARDLAQL